MIPTSQEISSARPISTAKRPLILAGLLLLRPKQWIKNGFVLGPLIFSRSFGSPHAADQAFIALSAFCLASSAGYIVNDIFDRESDRLHPEKRLKRPIAAGDLSVRQALVVFALVVVAIAGLLAGLPVILPIMAAYLGLTFSYSMWLKKIPVVDLFAIAAGFVLRIYAGAAAIQVPVSFWMSVTTLCLALYLAAMKRKQELARNGSGARGVLLRYTPALLTSYTQTAAVSAIVFYGFYVATSATSLVSSVPLVLFGLFRYQFLTDAEGAGETPGDVLFTDPILLAIILAWGILCIFLLR